MPDGTKPRPDPDTYYMGIALAVRARANCLGNRIGAVAGDTLDQRRRRTELFTCSRKLRVRLVPRTSHLSERLGSLTVSR